MAESNIQGSLKASSFSANYRFFESKTNSIKNPPPNRAQSQQRNLRRLISNRPTNETKSNLENNQLSLNIPQSLNIAHESDEYEDEEGNKSETESKGKIDDDNNTMENLITFVLLNNVVETASKPKIHNWLKEETLCLESFSGTCVSERSCGLLHPIYKGKPYLWQIHVPGKIIWDDLIESANEKLEKSFRNPSFDGCRIGPLVARFQLNENSNFPCLIDENIEFQRLSTKSSVKGNGENGLTYWTWYWQKSKDEWKEYQEQVIEALETSYLLGKEKHVFTEDNVTYVINFNEMTEKKEVKEGCAIKRTVTRRPRDKPKKKVCLHGNAMDVTETKLKTNLTEKIIPEKKEKKDLVATNPDNRSETCVIDGQNIELERIPLTKCEKIGYGAYAAVYRCENKEFGINIAMKQVDCLDNKKKVDALRQEMAILKKIKHKNIVRYYGLRLQENDSISILMEYAKGGTIHKLIKSKGALSEKKVSKYSKHILEGMAYLHENGIAHRDLKCANILLDDSDTCKLIDFGLSKNDQDVRSMSGCKTDCGSVYWMSPESFKGEKYGWKCDIWSFGCTVLEMLNKEPPYRELTYCAAMWKIVNEEMTPHFPLNVSHDCKEFTKVCLKRKPELRPSAQELLSYKFISVFNES